MWRMVTKVPILTLDHGGLLVGRAVWGEDGWSDSPLEPLPNEERARFVPWRDGLGWWFAPAEDGMHVAMVNSKGGMRVRRISMKAAEGAASFPTPMGAVLGGVWIHNGQPASFPPPLGPGDVTAVGEAGEIYTKQGRVFQRSPSGWKEENLPGGLTVFWAESGTRIGLAQNALVVMRPGWRPAAIWGPPHEGEAFIACAPPCRWAIVWTGPDQATAILGWEAETLRRLSLDGLPEAMVPVRDGWAMVFRDSILLAPEREGEPRLIEAGPFLRG